MKRETKILKFMLRRTTGKAMVLMHLLVALFVTAGSLKAQTDTEFWFVAPRVTPGHFWFVGGVSTAPGGLPIYLKITTQTLPATVRINQPANTYHPTLNPTGFQEIVVDLPEHTVHVIDLSPWRDIIENSWPDPKNDFGLHITATNLITAYYEVGQYFNPDIFSLKGRNALGTEFYTPFQTRYHNPASGTYSPDPYSAIDIVASMDNTVVTVNTRKASTLGPAGTYTINLNRGQTYTISPHNFNRLAGNRLDGTKITSNYPIAVTVMDDSVDARPHGGCRDLIGDQLIPTNIIGTEYIIMKGRLTIPEYAYVLATEDNTDVFVNGALAATINEGQTHAYLIPAGTTLAHIRTSHPSYLFHVAGFGCEMGGAVLPPTNVCTGSTQVGFTRSKAESFFLNILVRAGAEDGFLFNGAPHPILDPGIFQPVPGTSDWLAADIGSVGTGTIPIGVATMISNTKDVFHLGIINGGPTSGTMYGYFSDFNELEIRAYVSGTTSSVLRTCFGVPVRLFASGGTNYVWEPHSFLDNPFSATPLVNPIASTLYKVSVSGACNMADTATISVQVSAPIEAMFTFDEGSVCAPAGVTFSNHSTGGTNFRWYINSNLADMTLAPSDITYLFENDTDAPIDYTIDLVVRNDDGCSDQMQRTITVYPAINSDFTADVTEGCDPLPVEFTNLSTGNTDRWYWDFGDGNSSADQDNLHIFRNRPGPDDTVYNVSLVAISPWLCRDTSGMEITVSPYIEASFTFDQPSGCSPWELLITNESIGADTLYWDFGDGNSSTTTDRVFSYIYENPGNDTETYILSLRVVNEEGCEDYLEREVTVYPNITAGFTAEPEEGCSPHSVSFTNTSSGASRYYWEFGDGASSYDTNPLHTYPLNLGNDDMVYTVMLVAESEHLCTDTAFLDITVHPYIEASFTVDNIADCHPHNVYITNNSTGAVSYLWDFGDGSPAGTTGASGFSRTYRNTGTEDVTYELKLVVENGQGCKDSLSRFITVYPELTSNFLPSVTEGCEPLTVIFTDLSKNAALYSWDFDDGTGSNEPSPIHTFINTESSDVIRQVTLTTTSANGHCTAVNSWNIIVHGRITAGFETGSATGCNPHEIEFVNHTSGGESYSWDFGDGETLTTGSAAPFTHLFHNDSFSEMRDFSVRLLATNYAGCTSEIARTVTVFPDIDAAFSASETSGCHPLSVDFLNETRGGHSYLWDFGDGSTSTLENPSHTFTNTGTADSVYRVTLITFAANNECHDTFSMDITVHPYVNASFTLPRNTGCNPSDFLFENNSVNASVYYWDFGDGSDTTTYNTDIFTRRFSNNSFSSTALYQVTMRAESNAGCSSEVTKEVSVYPDIIAGIKVSDEEGCHPLTVNFSDTSQGGFYYEWDFGDGSSSSLRDPVHTFTNTGTADSVYRVRLLIIAANNVCADSAFVEIRVHPYVRAEFSFDEAASCPPFELEFTNSSAGAEKHIWDFGDGSDTVTFNTNSFIHIFANPSYSEESAYTVSLTAENYAGCTDRSEKVVRVYSDIKTAFSASFTEGCHPLRVEFENTTQGGVRYEWDFGDGASSDLHSPGHLFANTGSSPLTREVRLVAYSGNYCVSEKTVEITIYPNPRAMFETDNTTSCPPFDLPIVNTSIGADRYRWNFGNGNMLETGSPDPIYHTYMNNGPGIQTYRLSLIADTDYGCSDSTFQNIHVYPGVTTNFSSVTEGCNPLYVVFDNQTTGAISYHWDFGDGISIGVRQPEHLFFNNSMNDTSYYVQLTGISEYGCSDTAGYEIHVYPQPVAEFSVTPVFQEYPSASVDIVNAGNAGLWEYEWDFDDGNTSNVRDPGTYHFSDWGEYNITLAVRNDHCSDLVSHRIYIQPATPVADFNAVEPDCVPHTVQFRNNSIYGHSYYWDFDDGNTSTEIEPRHTFREHGVYNVKLIVTGEGGEDYTYREVEVYRLPVVNFRVAPETVLLPDEEIRLSNMSEYGSSYYWDFGDGNSSSEKDPRHLYTEMGEYDISLRVWTEHGCTDYMLLEKAVTVLGGGQIIFPNAFRPSNSGPSGGWYDPADPTSNTIFRPYWEGVVEYRLEIYNRWGEFLYASEDVMKGWDGYHQGQLCKQDVYVWKVWGTFVNGEKFIMAGDVTLLR